MEEESIGSIVRNRENNYVTGNTLISKYVSFSMYENIEKIEAYLNSKHISGETDSMDREKPFFNIVTAAVNIWYRATDIDRKNIRIKAAKTTEILGAFLATIHLQEFMKKDAFGVFLNDWGRALARYGSSVVKFVEAKGELHSSVIPWNRLIVDSVDFNNDVRIEKLFYTPAQLYQKKEYNAEQVDKLIDAVRESRKLLGGQQQDNKSEYIPVYEVHGVLPLSTLRKAQGKEYSEEDCDVYVQQMHVVSFVADEDDEDNYTDFTLVCGKEAKDPYMITHLIKEDGRTQAIGAVEHLFEAQWMNNHTVKLIKDQLDLASKLIFQTADGSFIGQNALDSMETGDILIHAENQPLTQLQNNSHDITALQNYGNQWKMLAQEITSTPDALAGNNMPSGTAYRQVAILNQEAHSLFEIMTENKGLAIEEMMRRFIIPYLKKQMDTTDEIAATLDSVGLQKVDLMYVNAEVVRRNNKHIAEQMFNNQVATSLDVGAEAQKIQAELNAQGDQRFFKPSELSDKTWKELFADLAWDVEVEVTNEQSDKEAVMTTLTTVLQTIATNPAILNDANARAVFNKILQATGELNPLELTPKAPPTQPAPIPSNIQPAQPVQPTT